MLKKRIAITLAAAMLTLSASSAFASFADLELIRVCYDRAGAEIGTDLGKVKDILAAPTTTVAGSFGELATGYVVYFALDRTTNELWATGSNTVPSTITGTIYGLTGLKSGTTSMYSWYNTQGGTNYTGLASDTNSYKGKISATQGNMAASITAASRLNTEASLASLITNGSGSVTQTLYYWANGLTTITAEKTGVAVATITTNFDGTTTINTPTPIPAAFYLMGSGLLGLVGLRRRNKVA
ncbi:MAG: hypothetical protein CXR30_19135 [Geobacter sp.]|nr:MAG: hypothetical protein CXR30_19135 [Geobacter sp.]